MGAPPRGQAAVQDADDYDSYEETYPDNCCFALFSRWGSRPNGRQPLLHQGGVRTAQPDQEPAWYARAAGKAKPLLERAAKKLEDHDCSGVTRRFRSRRTASADGGRRKTRPGGFGYGPEDYALNFEPEDAWFEDEDRPERTVFASRKGLI